MLKKSTENPRAQSAFLRACRAQKTDFTPIWLMRQAGRYMKSYRDLRAKVGFLELCKNPELAAQVTVEAQEVLNVDAAIIFSDILLILEPFGAGLSFSRGEGPMLARPVRSVQQVQALRTFSPIEKMPFVMEALRRTRFALKSNIPLIGFAGAPFTVASYLIEGRGGSDFSFTKKMMHESPSAWKMLLGKIADVTAEYLTAQVEAGADVVQIFDSWVGVLSPSDYAQHVLPIVQKLIARLPKNVPTIYFGTGAAGLLPLMQKAGADVLGLDWRVSLRETRQRLKLKAVQGNLDPALLLTDRATIKREAKRILDEARGRSGHVFNLGHGILPQTPCDNVIFLVDFVHEYGSFVK